MKFKVTLRSSVPFTRLGELSKSIEVEADSIEKAKHLGHTLLWKMVRPILSLVYLLQSKKFNQKKCPGISARAIFCFF